MTPAIPVRGRRTPSFRRALGGPALAKRRCLAGDQFGYPYCRWRSTHSYCVTQLPCTQRQRRRSFVLAQYRSFQCSQSGENFPQRQTPLANCEQFPTQTDTSTTATLPGCRCNRGEVGPADGWPPQAQGRHSTAKELKPKLVSSQISNEGTEHCNKNKELSHCCVQTMRQGF